jgi:hypothetical protein
VATATIKDPASLPVMLTMHDMQNFFGVSRETANKIGRRPDFPLFREGKCLRIPRDAFLRWLEQQTGSGVGEE